jgi:HlyD family secretion protein
LTQNSKVSFTVDAYPSDVFRGRVSQVRLAPQTVQNVVTYTAVIEVANPDLKLKPGMTASVTVVAAESDNVPVVPNTALRFRPDTQAAPAKRSRGPVVWKVVSGALTPVSVQTGITDGIRTEIVAGDLKEGDAIAVPLTANTGSKSATAPVKSPFAPSAPGGRGGR